MSGESEEAAQEARQLRNLFISPRNVTLGRDEEHVWACDAFVLLDVTGTLFGKLSDGAWSIVASKGYRETKGATIDVELALEGFAADAWSDVHETGWSVYDSDAKLYLLSDTGKWPRAINEDLWRDFRKRYPESAWQVDTQRSGTPRFRVVNDSKVIAYVAGVKLEGDQMDAALAICAASK